MNILKSILLKIIKKKGYQLVKIDEKPKGVAVSSDTMQATLRRVLNLGIVPAFIIDVGAAKGKWSEMAMQVWPDSNFKLIEPLAEQIALMPEAFLDQKKFKIYEAVAGNSEGYAQFTITEDFDGSGIYSNNKGNLRNVKVIPIDDVCFKDDKDAPILLKLDTHGFEIPIFEGAKKTLGNTAVIIVEVYGFNVSPTGKLFHEISAYLHEKGFRLFDIVNVIRRPKDKAFWQADAVYLKRDHPVFHDNNYQ